MLKKFTFCDLHRLKSKPKLHEYFCLHDLKEKKHLQGIFTCHGLNKSLKAL